LLESIRIVLVDTSHPGNIGAVARAMKNMGLKELYLVRPKFFPHAEATARAAGADDVLRGAVVVESLADGLRGCQFVVGTSARQRSLPWPVHNPRECAENIKTVLATGAEKAAVVFGNEQSGLSNDELAQCNIHLHIPVDGDFSSLNLAQAVQVVTYELRMSALENQSLPQSDRQLASAEEMELFYQQLEASLIHLGYLKSDRPGRLMLRLRRLFNRIQVEQNEAHILLGILSTIKPISEKSS
jgi:tRNA (cytidine32/uridine32-2'-O)-methyltransferase